MCPCLGIGASLNLFAASLLSYLRLERQTDTISEVLKVTGIESDAKR